MRKLASIRVIENILPIDGADAIEVATIGGWKVVVKKAEFAVGDLAVYFEIDSWIPTELAPFLSKGKEPREYEGVKGERLRTIKLRGQLSQGLLLPLDNKIWDIVGGQIFGELTEDGTDMTELLNIKKWEKPINAQLAGVCKGNFPSLIPKTDQERVQNLKKEIAAAQGMVFEVTEKMEGSSMTVYMLDGVFGVCSRNMDLKETEGNSFWVAARENNIEAKMRELEMDNVAIQGELIGPGIQGNIYKLGSPQFHVFDVYNVKMGAYLTPNARHRIVDQLGLTHVPIITTEFILNGHDIDTLLVLAERKSELADTEREGIVFKQVDGGMTFKAISNKYLLGEK